MQWFQDLEEAPPAKAQTLFLLAQLAKLQFHVRAWFPEFGHRPAFQDLAPWPDSGEPYLSVYHGVVEVLIP